MIEILNLHTCFSPLPISSALFILYFWQGHIECIMIIFTPNYPQVSPFLASEPHYPSHLVATPLEKTATLPARIHWQTLVPQVGWKSHRLSHEGNLEVPV